MSRSRKHTPIGGIATCRSEKYAKRIWNRQFRSIVNALIRSGEYDWLPEKLRDTSEIWNGGKDGKTFHDHAYRGKCGLNWCYIRCWECQQPWKVWGK